MRTCCSECASDDECIWDGYNERKWNAPLRKEPAMDLEQARLALAEYDREMRYLICVDHALEWAIKEIERLYSVQEGPKA